MNSSELKEIVEGLIETTEMAGKKTVELQKGGLKIEIKPDNSPVSNGDLEVNRIVTKKILSNLSSDESSKIANMNAKRISKI